MKPSKSSTCWTVACSGVCSGAHDATPEQIILMERAYRRGVHQAIAVLNQETEDMTDIDILRFRTKLEEVLWELRTEKRRNAEGKVLGFRTNGPILHMAVQETRRRLEPRTKKPTA